MNTRLDLERDKRNMTLMLTYKAKKTVRSNIAENGIAKSDPSTVTWKPNKDEQKMPRFRKKTKKTKGDE